MANLFQPSLQRATDSNGRPVSGAKMFFFRTGTTAQPALNATNRIVSPTSIGDKVDGLTVLQETNQGEIDDNASDISRLQGVVGPLLSVAMADAANALASYVAATS